MPESVKGWYEPFGAQMYNEKRDMMTHEWAMKSAI